MGNLCRVKRSSVFNIKYVQRYCIVDLTICIFYAKIYADTEGLI